MKYMSEIKEKDRVQITDTDLVYDNNSKKLYRGLEYTGSDSAKTNIPLESRALVTEQQLNYLAKDIRDYLDEENYVSYNKYDNRTDSERKTAIENIFGNGVLKELVTKIEENLLENANGVTTYNSSSSKQFEDLIKNAKHVIILTSEARYGDYGIPILSEYFQDVFDSDIIYRDETYKNLYNENNKGNNWRTNYKNFLLDNPSINNGLNNSADLERRKNKWRFADFYRVAYGDSDKGSPYLKGLYGTQPPSSVPAFCEYIALPYNTCVPTLLANLEENDILYQPSTGKIFRVKKDNKHTTANTLMTLDLTKITSGRDDSLKKYATATYQTGTIYGEWDNNPAWIDEVEKNNSNMTCFESEEAISKKLNSYNENNPPKYRTSNNTVTDERSQAETHIANGKTLYRIDANFGGTYGKSLIAIYTEKRNNKKFDYDECLVQKFNYIDGDYNYVVELNTKEVEGGDHVFCVNQNSIENTQGKHTTKFSTDIEKTWEVNVDITDSSLPYNEKRHKPYRTILNDTTPRIYYNTAILNKEKFGEEIVKHYPCGAMAIYCEEIGTYKPNSLWKFIGENLYSAGTEFPKDSFQKILSTPDSAANISVGDFIYNPFSSELRQVSRDLCPSETGATNSYLTKPVLGYMHNESDGVGRANGSYLRGASLHYLIPEENSVIDNNRHIPKLPNFIQYIKENINNADYRLKLKQDDNIYVDVWEDALNNLKNKNILDTSQNNTKVVFNTLYLLPQMVLKNIHKTQSQIRFLQLNNFIPGDYIIDIQGNRCDLYQITCAPYLYDIFDIDKLKISTLTDKKSLQKLFVNYMYSKWQYPRFKKNTEINDIFLGNLFLTLIKREEESTEDFYCLASNTNFQYHFNYDQSEKENYFQFRNEETKINEWFNVFLKDFVGSEYETVANYAKENASTYIDELRQRLLTNYSCPIAVDGILINSFYFSNNEESSEEIPQSIIDELNRLEQQKAGFSDLTNLQTTLISTINSRNYYSKPQNGIGEEDLTIQLQNKLNSVYHISSIGIPENDLSQAVKDKLNAPNTNYIREYEHITYDKDEGRYILTTDQREETLKRNYKKGDLIVNPQLNNVFEIENNGGFSNTTPTFVNPLLPRRNSTFIFKYSGSSVYGYHLKGYGAYDDFNENTGKYEHEEFLEAVNSLQHQGNLNISFETDENLEPQITDNLQLSGGTLSILTNENVTYYSIIIPFIYQQNNYNFVWSLDYNSASDRYGIPVGSVI